MCHIQTMTIPVVSTVTQKPRFVRVTALSATGLIFLRQSNDSGEWPSFYKPPAQSHLLSNYHVDLVSPLINLLSTLRRSPGHSRVGRAWDFDPSSSASALGTVRGVRSVVPKSGYLKLRTTHQAGPGMEWERCRTPQIHRCQHSFMPVSHEQPATPIVSPRGCHPLSHPHLQPTANRDAREDKLLSVPFSKCVLGAGRLDRWAHG